MRKQAVLWHILHVNKSDMLFQVYNVQTVSSIPRDWVRLLEADKEWFKITLSDEEIMSISKYKMKNYFRKMSEILTLEYIENLKEKHEVRKV